VREIHVEREVELHREVLANVKEIFINTPVNREVTVERQVAVVQEVVVEREVPVIREVIMERRVPVMKEIFVDREVIHEVITEREVPIYREIIVEKPVIHEVIIEKEVPMVREVIVERQVVHEVTIERNSRTQRRKMTKEELTDTDFNKDYKVVDRIEIVEVATPIEVIEYVAPVESVEYIAPVEVVEEEMPHATIEVAPTESTRRDDLKVVEGIGPKIEELLNNCGIYTFDQLANTHPDQIRSILEAAGPRYQIHNPETWPAQSSMAAMGRWDDLTDWQGKLSAGRIVD
jgi:predicted flap endonuclease-1-like 5' DNA nuclease